MRSTIPLFNLFSLLICLLLANVALADDIEVYGANSGGGNKPNVLFIIDNSGSMNEGVDGEEPAVGEDSKMDILRQVFDQVVSTSVGKINAGLMLFNNKTSGIKWPITDLKTIASTIDPDITTVPELTTKDILSSLVLNSSGYDKTNYVSPIIEARDYFKGSPIWLNDWSWVPDLVPPKWQGDHYNTNWPQYWTPNKATYLPQDAYKPGNTGPNPHTTDCWNGQKYDPALDNNCEGHDLVPNSCVYHPSSTSSYQNCKVSQVCTASDEGGCINWECPAGQLETVSYTSAEHDICSYYDGSWETPNYVSPIGSSCQSNFIILLSDGLPTVNDKKWYAEELLANSGVSSCANMGSMFFDDDDNHDGDCAAELIENMATTDMIAAVPGSSVATYTIGFGLVGDEAEKGKNYLTHLAEKGGGEFFAANSYNSLVTSLNTLIDSISGEVDDFTGVSVGVRNSSFSNDNRAFINLFKPSANRSWPGNMKGYFLSSDGLIDIEGNAVVNADGTLNSESQSFWSANVDGSVVVEGGLDESISAGNRNLYTYTGSALPSGIDLTSADQALSTDNVALTNTMLGVTDQAGRNDLLDWVATAPVSDPLHSKPTIAKYASGEVVFTMTNQGFIHAVDAATPIDLHDDSGGEELYAFIPQELLVNLGQIKANLSTGGHIYGLDGQITLHHEDNNLDGVINSNETARLYIGMRRGGKSYYALDISSKTSPRLLWQIKGGEGDYSAMGQSWSRMSLTTLKSGTDKKVLIFGGGYDAEEDSKTSRSAGSGNRVFIANAATGEHLWSAGAGASGINATGMNYSVPSDLALIDVNGNGYTDHIYFGDLGGQLWRIKFEETLGANGAPTNNFTSNASIKKIADFGTSANRKFFYPPAVALMSQKGNSYLAITIGSGNRAHPLNETVQDMVFMVRDPLDSPVTTTLLLSDLYNATDNKVGQGSDKADQRAEMNDADGWYIKLTAGEKSLSKLIIYDKKLRFTTYQPTEIVTQSCSASSSSKGRYYVMNLDDATPSSDHTVDESVLTDADRSQDIAVQGIPSEPNILFPPDGKTVEVFIGKENISSVVQDVKMMHWKQVR